MKKGAGGRRPMCSVRSCQENFPPPAARPISEPAAERKRRKLSEGQRWEITPDMEQLPDVNVCVV